MMPLITTDWLAANLDDPDLRIADVTYFMAATGRNAREEFKNGHIPGAVFFDIDTIKDPDNPLPHMVPDPESFAAAMSALGIGDEHRVVVYDAHGLMSAARGWWMLRLFGHDAVGLLDGGLPKWVREGRPLESGLPHPAPANFSAKFRPELIRTLADIQRITATRSGAVQLVDARSAGRFAGTEPEPRAGLPAGHMPQAINLPYTSLLDPVSKTLLPPTEIDTRIRAAGINPDAPIITTCGSGVTACVVSFGLHLIGQDSAVYDGSWTEWASTPGNLIISEADQ